MEPRPRNAPWEPASGRPGAWLGDPQLWTPVCPLQHLVVVLPSVCSALPAQTSWVISVSVHYRGLDCAVRPVGHTDNSALRPSLSKRENSPGAARSPS